MNSSFQWPFEVAKTVTFILVAFVELFFESTIDDVGEATFLELNN